MHALFAYNACMKTKQYTIRGVPERFDRAAKREALASRQSLNLVLLKALERGLDLGPEPVRYADMDDLAGTWVRDPAFDRALADMDKVDEALWK